MGIAYNEEQVRQHLIDSGVWPSGSTDEDGVEGARDWWIRLLKEVTYGVNDADLADAEEVHDTVTEIAESAADRFVSEARAGRKVLMLCEMSDIDRVMNDPFDDEIYLRLTSGIVDSGDGTEGVYPRSGERYDDPGYRERKREAQHEHRAKVGELLRLGSVAARYLEGAASMVARSWCEAQVEKALTQWRCELCEETFAADNQADYDECEERTECVVHTGEANCDDHDCSFPHSLVRNDAV
jgi:hypothetical protein